MGNQPTPASRAARATCSGVRRHAAGSLRRGPRPRALHEGVPTATPRGRSWWQPSCPLGSLGDSRERGALGSSSPSRPSAGLALPGPKARGGRWAGAAAYHGLLHLHLDDVLVDVVAFILARDAVVDVLPQVMLAAREGSRQREGVAAEGRGSSAAESSPSGPPSPLLHKTGRAPASPRL